MKQSLVKCNKCGWVHFEMDPKDIKYKFEENPYLEECFRCGNHYLDFSEAKENDLPRGSTIQAIKKRGKLKKRRGTARD